MKDLDTSYTSTILCNERGSSLMTHNNKSMENNDDVRMRDGQVSHLIRKYILLNFLVFPAQIQL